MYTFPTHSLTSLYMFKKYINQTLILEINFSSFYYSLFFLPNNDLTEDQTKAANTPTEWPT